MRKLSVLCAIGALLFAYTNCSGGFKSTELSPIQSSSSFACKPPRRYTFTLQPGQEKTFACTPTYLDIFNVQIPDTGYAIGRASLVFRNNNSNQIYFWAASVLVGTPLINYGHGDDICPNGATQVKRVLGYGLLTPENGSTVRVTATQGSSPCVDDQISVLSGGTLEVWVEDPDPRCHKKDINMISSYDTLGSGRFNWTTSMSQLLTLDVPASVDRSQLLVLGAVEGSPDENPNQVCGEEAATLVAQVTASSYGIVDTQTDRIPASGGMGHLVLSPQANLSYSPAVSSISLLVGSNTGLTTIFTNGCCGDGKLGFVKLK